MKHILIIFNELSIAKSCLRLERAPLDKVIHQLDRKWTAHKIQQILWQNVCWFLP